MDWFSLCLTAAELGAQGVLQLAFSARLTGKPCRARHFAAYLLLLAAAQGALSAFPRAGALGVPAMLAALYGVNRLALRNRLAVSAAAATLAVCIAQLAFGMVNSIEAALLPPTVRGAALYALLLLAVLAGTAVCAGCCLLALRLLSLREAEAVPSVGLLLFPGMFCLTAERYLMRTAYSRLPASYSLRNAAEQLALFLLQALGLTALLCTLYAYRRICRGFQTQAALASLRQAARAQQSYLDEARGREERTRSFRHDVQNQLAVVDGLLASGRTEEARRYLGTLRGRAAELSARWRTGNPTADILLGEKLGLAEADGVRTEVSLLLPDPCGIDGPDLCVIFANALDNAAAACRSAGAGAFIRVGGGRQGDLLRVRFENACDDGPLPSPGTGLSNIQAAAEKYGGAALWEKGGGRFRLDVLLNISLPPDDRSGQTPCIPPQDG